MSHSNDSRRARSRVTSLGLAVRAALWLMPGGLALAATTCAGDCATDGEVTTDELVTLVHIVLGNTAHSECLAGEEGQRAKVGPGDVPHARERGDHRHPRTAAADRRCAKRDLALTPAARIW